MKNTARQPRIAIVYDRVNTRFGGAEHVLLALHDIFPDAPLFTAVYDPQQADWASLFDVHTTFLQKIPGAKTHHRQFVGLMPLAFEALKLDEFDIILSVTSAEAKGVLTKPDQLHICYLLTPTRYLWSHADEYQQSWLIEKIKQPIFSYLRWWDEAAALRPDVIVPISLRVADRCQAYYKRSTSPVIYPPAETPKNADAPEPLPTPLVDALISSGSYYLVVSRLVGYKKVACAIDACANLGKPLVIIGDGPEAAQLEKQISKIKKKRRLTTPILIIKSVLSEQLAAYYKNCRAFLAPGEEDFGIAALEANAFGKPSILHPQSGVAEVSPDGVASVHLKLDAKVAKKTNDTKEVTTALQHAIVTCEAHTWDAQRIRTCAVSLSTAEFQEQFHQRVMKEWTEFYAR